MKIPFLAELEEAEKVLIAGAGGGFDVFCGLPLYLNLRAQGKTVHLANLTFTELAECRGQRHAYALMEINPDTKGPAHYFPELYLTRWLKARLGGDPCVYAIDRVGAIPIQAAYDWLCKELAIDTLILVDGGTDILMRGDETGLGTPQEDIASLSAAYKVEGPVRKLVACLGFGVDFFHGVSHGLFLQNVAALAERGGYLGAWSLTKEMEEFRLYEEAYRFTEEVMPQRPSIVNTSINAAVNGRFGDYHSTKRTRGSELFINPLMALYWGFRLEQVAAQNLYLERIAGTQTYEELSWAIENFRNDLLRKRRFIDIPC
jgi:hypothetical protein